MMRKTPLLQLLPRCHGHGCPIRMASNWYAPALRGVIPSRLFCLACPGHNTMKWYHTSKFDIHNKALYTILSTER